MTGDGRPLVSPPDDEPSEPAPTGEERGPSRPSFDEDWAATIVGLVLLLLVLAGVITKGMVP